MAFCEGGSETGLPPGKSDRLMTLWRRGCTDAQMAREAGVAEDLIISSGVLRVG